MRLARQLGGSRNGSRDAGCLHLGGGRNGS